MHKELSVFTAPIQPDPDGIERLAGLFHALGDPSRLHILTLLLAGEQNVGALAAQVGISEPGVSFHLRLLRQLRIVRARRQGREIYYRLDDEHVAEVLQRGWEHVAHA